MADDPGTANVENGEFDDERFNFLRGGAKKFCEAVGLRDNLILDIYASDSDWSFILKIDALVDVAAKSIIKTVLKLDVFGIVGSNDRLTEFVELLPMRGRTSLLKLLQAAGCPSEEAGFIDSIRQVRNSYAHEIHYVDMSLIELIKQRPDRSKILKNLSAIENYNEAKLIESYQKDGGMLRFGILDCTLRFLFYAYRITVEQK